MLLATFNKHPNYISSIIILLFLNEIANIRCAAYCTKFFTIKLISKVSTLSPMHLNPPLIILLRKLQCITSNCSNWPTVKFQFWHHYLSLLQTKTTEKPDPGFKVNLSVLKEVGHSSKFCIFYQDMVINFTVRFVLGDIWTKIFKLSRVMKQYIAKTDYSMKRHMVLNNCFCYWSVDTKTIIGKCFIKNTYSSLQWMNV